MLHERQPSSGSVSVNPNSICLGNDRCSTQGVPPKPSNTALASGLIFAVLLWGGNNTGTKFIVANWPPIWTGASRFFCAGLILLVILRWTTWLGMRQAIPQELQGRLWWSGGLSLAVYVVTFNTALRYTSASHVALYLGAAPVWALLWEGWPALNRGTLKRFAAAALALSGVLVLFWPSLRVGSGSWLGELLGLSAGVLWTNYGRQCRSLGVAHGDKISLTPALSPSDGERETASAKPETISSPFADKPALSGVEISAHTMWRAGTLLLPLALIEIYRGGLVWRADVAAVQLYCIVAGGVVSFAMWSNALRYWPTSQVLLFNNLIPLSTMIWARVWLGESITHTFWLAMLLVLGGVLIAQLNWGKLIAMRALPPE
jgi:drug/metabolite transporter (DMT)-like permease